MLSKTNLSLLFISLLSTSTLSSALAPGERIIPILKDKVGFYFEADIGTETQPDPARLVPSFASSHSLFGKGCYGFKDFDCSECHFSPNKGTLETPHTPYTVSRLFTIKGVPNSIFWNLNRRVFVKGEDCSEKKLDFGNTRSGILGMGIAWSLVYFPYPKAFSVTMNKELTNGTLYYRSLPKSPRAPTATFGAEKDWTFNFGTSDYLSGSFRDSLRFKAYFDINAEALGFSDLFYDKVVAELKKIMKCSQTKFNYFKPVCQYEGSIKDLKPLDFRVQEDGILSIPPEVYIDSLLEDGIARLNIKRMNYDSEGLNYVSWKFESESFGRNLIILDAKFMSHFETVFDLSDFDRPKIKLYTPDSNDVPQKDEEKEEKKDDKGKSDKEKEKEKDKEEEKEKKKDNTGKESLDNGKTKDNDNREDGERSFFSMGTFTIFLVVALLLIGVYVAYSKFRGNKDVYQSLNQDAKSEVVNRSQKDESNEML